MKPLEQRLFILSTRSYSGGRESSERYYDCGAEATGSLVLTRDRRYAKTFTDWRAAHDVVLAVWARYRCALYLKEVPCEISTNGWSIPAVASSARRSVSSSAK